MIKNLPELQSKSKYEFFAKRLTLALKKKNIEPSPAAVARAFNQYTPSATLKPHTVRKWLLGVSHPRADSLQLLAQWLGVKLEDLLAEKQAPNDVAKKERLEFDFVDQEIIAKYLALNERDKNTVRIVIKAITEKNS